MTVAEFNEVAREYGADSVLITVRCAVFRSPHGMTVSVELPDGEFPALEAVVALETVAILTGKVACRYVK